MTVSFRRVSAGAALLSLAGLLGGCSGFSQALGLSKVQPDEFAIVTQAPLIVPPDFSLKPPQPGINGPAQTDSDVVASRALLGDPQAFTPGMTQGERVLVGSAGATFADPLIREVVDREYADLARESETLSNRLMFGTRAPETEKTINARAEADRLAEEGNPAPSEDTGAEPAVDTPEGQAKPTIKKSGGSSVFEGLF